MKSYGSCKYTISVLSFFSDFQRVSACIDKKNLIVIHWSGENFRACFYDISRVLEHNPDDRPLINLNLCSRSTTISRSFDIMGTKIESLYLHNRWCSLPEEKYKWREFKSYESTEMSDEEEPTWDDGEAYAWNEDARKWENAATDNDQSAAGKVNRVTIADMSALFKYPFAAKYPNGIQDSKFIKVKSFNVIEFRDPFNFNVNIYFSCR